MIQNNVIGIMFLSFIGVTSIVSMDRVTIESALCSGVAGTVIGGGTVFWIKQLAGDDCDLSDLIVPGSVGFVSFAVADLICSATNKRERIPEQKVPKQVVVKFINKVLYEPSSASDERFLKEVGKIKMTFEKE